MDGVYKAISDPSRRAVLDLLMLGDRTVSELLSHFNFSQPALSRHLRVLREAGLVTVQSDGRARRYALKPERLRTVAEWVRHYERFWNDRLDDLGALLDEEESS